MKNIFLSCLLFILPNTAMADPLVFEKMKIQLDAPENCKTEKLQTGSIRAMCTDPTSLIVYQQGSYKALSAALQMMKDTPPEQMKNPKAQDIQTKTFKDGSESKMLMLTFEDPKGELLGNMSVLISSPDKEHGLMINIIAGKKEDKEKLKELTKKAMDFKAIKK